MKVTRPVARPVAKAAADAHDAAVKAANFINSRREQLASSILFNAVAKSGIPAASKELAEKCVYLADQLIEALYGPTGKDGAIKLATLCFSNAEEK